MTAVAPSSGPAGGDAIVTITGTNLTGATAVDFGSETCPQFHRREHHRDSRGLPSGHGCGQGDRHDCDGTGCQRAYYTYIPAPTVGAVNPSAGAATGGVTVTITGTGFTGTTGVEFGATAASRFTVDSNTQITATAPPGTSTVNITITAPGGTSAIQPRTGTPTRTGRPRRSARPRTARRNLNQAVPANSRAPTEPTAPGSSPASTPMGPRTAPAP